MNWETLKDKKIQQFIKDHAEHDPFSLGLKAKQFPDFPMRLITEQIQARQKAKSKLPSWYQTEGIIFPPLLSMEQCSSEATARYKARVIKGDRLLDLTGGSAVDTYYIGQNFQSVVYTEIWEELFQRSQHNLQTLGADHIKCHFGDGVDYLKTQAEFDVIFLDPYRRDEQKNKVFLLSDCLPNVIELQALLLKKGKDVWIKASPMLDIKGALQQLPQIQEVHVIAVQNDCKEVLFRMNKESRKDIQFFTTNLLPNGKSQDLSYSQIEETTAEAPLSEPLQYLYEPNVAIMKAGGFKIVAEQYQLKKLHPHSHLYTSEKLVPGFPGRSFLIEGVEAVNKKIIKKYCKDGKANLAIRNFPSTVADLRKKLKLKEGGENYLFATTLKDDKKVLIFTKKAL
ncbi:THUMP-like domain-containing protein [Persicobacter diffluens]|uniref:THUMP-like domain-containing protein n=1 Tax=Persicobacter diffluens TaxID=981 RepID=A0AAN5AJX4_9BACT|nr:hypothetical protein PEDI_26920 [Persicobacter diffluens]